jgi:enoyl-CoA hydratase/carnithine racemase
VGQIKRAVQSSSEVSLEQGMAVERELQQRLFASQDAKEGFAAFLQKRDAVFRGR